MLFPKNAKKDPEGKYLLEKMENCHLEAINPNSYYWSEAAMDARFEAGDATIWREIYANMPRDMYQQFNFNRIHRVVEMIVGRQRNERKSVIVVPIENGDDETAEIFSKLFVWLQQKEGLLETISESFQGAIITGMNLLQVWVDYRNDPVSGDIKIDNCAYNSFLIDPYFRKQDLSDCNYIWKRSFLSAEECASLLPDRKEEILRLPRSTETRDDKFQFMPEHEEITNPDLLSYDEFYYKTYRKQKLLVDSLTGEVLEWELDDTNALNEFVGEYNQLTVQDSYIPTVNLGIVIQGKVFYNDKNPLGIDKYPFAPVFAYYRPEMPSYYLRLQGVVRNLRDAQYLYNRRKIIELDMLESQVNSGFIYKEDSLIDKDSVFQSGQGRGIPLKKNAQMTDVMPIQAPVIPPSTIELSRLLGEEIQQISGVSEELLGSATDDKAGILSMLRQGAALVTLKSLYDRLDWSQKILGNILLKVMQNNFTPGKVKRITDQEPTQEFYNKFFGKYDCQVSAGILTDTQRQMAFAQALYLKEAGINIPDKFFVDNMAIQNKKEILAQMEQAQQAQQQQEQQAQQIQMQELAARAELSKARVEEQLALANERNTRSVSNLGLSEERRWASYKANEEAQLAKIRALSELEDIDLSKLERLINMLKIVNESGDQKPEGSVSQNGSANQTSDRGVTL